MIKMKYIIALAIAVVATIDIQAQKLDQKLVPLVVKSALQKQYAKATEVEWNKEDSLFEASFEINEMEISILINNKGQIIETETEVDLNELPKAISSYILSNYPNKKLLEGSKIVDASGHVFYEAEIKGMELLFDEKGTFIRQIKD